MSEIVEQAIRAGKILASSRATYERLVKAKPKATERALAKMVPALTPPATTGEVGADHTAAPPTDDRYPTGWLNDREKVRAEGGGSGPAAVPVIAGDLVGGPGSGGHIQLAKD